MSDVHVRLRVGREGYALPIENVREVAELGELATVPGAGAAVLGVRNLNGQVLPVFDLASVFGITRDGRPPRIVVAEQNGRVVGLAVDEVTEVSPLGSEREDADPAFLSCAVLEDGRLVGVVDVERMFESLEREAA